MIKDGFRRKPSLVEGEINHALFFANIDLERITKSQPLRDYINSQYLKYIAHVCRGENTKLTKLSFVFIPRVPYYRDPWIGISRLLGDLPIEQIKRETQSKTGFTRLLGVLTHMKPKASK